ncbi:hypothetical protein, partial [Methylocaldum sp.]|uniref:hypothetical protein n=1 Tax=Methylocaldum sp. TaxID=1969727 RepID=UPI00322086D5
SLLFGEALIEIFHELSQRHGKAPLHKEALNKWIPFMVRQAQDMPVEGLNQRFHKVTTEAADGPGLPAGLRLWNLTILSWNA